MSDKNLPNDLLEKLGGRKVVYFDNRYILVELDSLNWGIISTQKLRKVQHVKNALLGYYSPGVVAISELVKLHLHDDIIEKVGTSQSFTDIEALVNESLDVVLKYAKSISHTVLGQKNLDDFSSSKCHHDGE
ncbi:MAG: hypothetical protein ACFE9L_09005 [Candidatus Hodarchaeota archaeon]